MSDRAQIAALDRKPKVLSSESVGNDPPTRGAPISRLHVLFKRLVQGRLISRPPDSPPDNGPINTSADDELKDTLAKSLLKKKKITENGEIKKQEYACSFSSFYFVATVNCGWILESSVDGDRLSNVDGFYESSEGEAIKKKEILPLEIFQYHKCQIHSRFFKVVNRPDDQLATPGSKFVSHGGMDICY
ncbi:hypothetical protein CEXT_545351 [Caerostris extrusa]|uniref:Uncharacterized protein n=1 Tax=Caerostris extrusa TaxID=172846 RepID=A0AAV4SA11_CAEEX|nr:hypothetical protein CEXT_545351 [Caerostris extrusa]